MGQFSLQVESYWFLCDYVLSSRRDYFPEPDGSADTSMCLQCSAQSWHLGGALFQLIPEAIINVDEMVQRHGEVEISIMAQFFTHPQMHVLSHET